MGQSRVLSDTTLQIRRNLLGPPRERVFKAWTDPEGLKKWFGHDDTCLIPFAEVDLRAGGRYRIRIETEKGEPIRSPESTGKSKLPRSSSSPGSGRKEEWISKRPLSRLSFKMPENRPPW